MDTGFLSSWARWLSSVMGKAGKDTHRKMSATRILSSWCGVRAERHGVRNGPLKRKPGSHSLCAVACRAPELEEALRKAKVLQSQYSKDPLKRPKRELALLHSDTDTQSGPPSFPPLSSLPHAAAQSPRARRKEELSNGEKPNTASPRLDRKRVGTNPMHLINGSNKII